MFQHVVHTHSLVHCAASRKVAGSMPMVSLEFLIDIILPAALWHWDRLSLQKKSVRGILPEDKSGFCVGLINLPPSCADSLEIWETPPPGALRACQDVCGESSRSLHIVTAGL
jgi:hypothetical protein